MTIYLGLMNKSIIFAVYMVSLTKQLHLFKLKQYDLWADKLLQSSPKQVLIHELIVSTKWM